MAADLRLEGKQKTNRSLHELPLRMSFHLCQETQENKALTENSHVRGILMYYSPHIY